MIHDRRASIGSTADVTGTSIRSPLRRTENVPRPCTTARRMSDITLAATLSTAALAAPEPGVEKRRRPRRRMRRRKWLGASHANRTLSWFPPWRQSSCGHANRIRTYFCCSGARVGRMNRGAISNDPIVGGSQRMSSAKAGILTKDWVLPLAKRLRDGRFRSEVGFQPTKEAGRAGALPRHGPSFISHRVGGEHRSDPGRRDRE
jgi:hypothetical protein